MSLFPVGKSPDYYLDLVRRAAPHLQQTPDEAWLERLDAEREALFAAFASFSGMEAVEYALGLWRWCLARAHMVRGLHMLMQAYADCPSLRQSARAQVFSAIGHLSCLTGQFAEAEAFLDLAWQLASRLQLSWDMAAIRLYQGKLYRTQGRLALAALCYHSSLRLWQAAGDVWGEAAAHDGLGTVAWMQGRAIKAQAHLQHSAELFAQSNDIRQSAKVRNNAALLATDNCNYELAERLHRQSLSRFQQLKDRTAEGIGLNNLGLLLCNRGKMRQGYACIVESLSILHEIEHNSDAPTMVASLGEVMSLAAEEERALIFLSAYQAINRQRRTVLPRKQTEALEACIASIKARLDTDVFDKLWLTGQALSIPEVLTRAKAYLNYNWRQPLPAVPIGVSITGPITGGDNFSITITLDSVVSSDTQISLACSNTAVLQGLSGTTKVAFPRRATVAAGSASVVVPLASNTVSSATTVDIYAGPAGAVLPGGATATGTVTVNP